MQRPPSLSDLTGDRFISVPINTSAFDPEAADDDPFTNTTDGGGLFLCSTPRSATTIQQQHQHRLSPTFANNNTGTMTTLSPDRTSVATTTRTNSVTTSPCRLLPSTSPEYGRSLRNAMNLCDGDILSFRGGGSNQIIDKNNNHNHHTNNNGGTSPTMVRTPVVSHQPTTQPFPISPQQQHQQQQQQSPIPFFCTGSMNQVRGGDGASTPPMMLPQHPLPESSTCLPPLGPSQQSSNNFYRNNNNNASLSLSPAVRTPVRPNDHCPQQQQQQNNNSGNNQASPYFYSPLFFEQQQNTAASGGGGGGALSSSSTAGRSTVPFMSTPRHNNNNFSPLTSSWNNNNNNNNNARNSPPPSFEAAVLFPPTTPGGGAAVSSHQTQQPQPPSPGGAFFSSSPSSPTTATQQQQQVVVNPATLLDFAQQQQRAHQVGTQQNKAATATCPHNLEYHLHHHHSHSQGSSYAAQQLHQQQLVCDSRPFRVLEAQDLPGDVDSSPIAWAPGTSESLIISLSKQVFLWTPVSAPAAAPPPTTTPTPSTTITFDDATQHGTTNITPLDDVDDEQAENAPLAPTAATSIIEPLFEGRFDDEVSAVASAPEVCEPNDDDDNPNYFFGEKPMIIALGKTDGLILVLRLSRRRNSFSPNTSSDNHNEKHHHHQQQQQQQHHPTTKPDSPFFFVDDSHHHHHHHPDNDEANSAANEDDGELRHHDHHHHELQQDETATISNSPSIPKRLEPATSSRWRETSRRVISVHSHSSRIVALQIVGHLLFSASDDGMIFCTCLDTYEVRFSFEVDSPIVALSVSPDNGNHLAVGLQSGGIVVVPMFSVKKCVQLESCMVNFPAKALEWIASSSFLPSAGGGGGGGGHDHQGDGGVLTAGHYLLVHAGGVNGDELVVSSVVGGTHRTLLRVQTSHPIVRLHHLPDCSCHYDSSNNNNSNTIHNNRDINIHQSNNGGNASSPGVVFPNLVAVSSSSSSSATSSPQRIAGTAAGSSGHSINNTATSKNTNNNTHGNTHPILLLVLPAERPFDPEIDADSGNADDDQRRRDAYLAGRVPNSSMCVVELTAGFGGVRKRRECLASHTVAPPVHSVYNAGAGVLTTGSGEDNSLRFWHIGPAAVVNPGRRSPSAAVLFFGGGGGGSTSSGSYYHRHHHREEQQGVHHAAAAAAAVDGLLQQQQHRHHSRTTSSGGGGGLSLRSTPTRGMMTPWDSIR